MDKYKKMNYIGILIVLSFFLLFYIFATFFLNKHTLVENKVDTNNELTCESINYDQEISIINSLYKDVRILYDVVNNKFKVNQDDIIVIGDITYKKITNFNEVMDNLFTETGQKKYISDLGSYFASTDTGYYMAGNLVSYQTYYFRGDDTNIYITSANSEEINGIIYERWTSNNKNTLATIKIVNQDNQWLIDEINILSTD